MNLVDETAQIETTPHRAPECTPNRRHHHTSPKAKGAFPLSTRLTASSLPPSSTESKTVLSTADTNGSAAPSPPRPETVPVTQGRTTKMASSSNDKDKLSHPRPSRPAISTTHSNSVPSTPYQQPRDIRFPSRSPSPHRGLTSQSPQSVVSEAVGKVSTFPSDRQVCKFETGAEIRKRRIPYVEGGNEELGPPKKELKKTLEPHEDEKLSGDMRELYDRLLPSDESEERRALLVKKLQTLLHEKWPGSEIHVNVFGSSGNLLSSSDSDVDICVTTPLKQLESMHSIALLLSENGMEKVVCRASAKVPIVKCWDPELRMACDLNVNNPLALENTRMIKTYVQLDDRVRPLTKIIKYWTKRRLLNDAAYGGTISSYTWICMVINFLQRRNPPILPSIQKLQGHRKPQSGPEESTFADDLDAMKDYGAANKESLAELLFQFFRHYGYEFDFAKNVVSIKEGRPVSRKEKGWEPTNYVNKEARCRLCVEEPFTTDRNLGNSADDYAWSGIHGEIRRAFEFLADSCQLDKACEQFEFPPEEKPIFQKPVPKPAPTLRRSASQSGSRTSQEQGSGRSRKSNRNNSAQRNGNRRASSGASFGSQRTGSLPYQNPLGAGFADYFALKGNLHDQLYQQYQYLQAQQDALRSQLQAQQAAQGRVGDLAGASPHIRSFPNGILSPRYSNDNSPQTAPILPGYMYQFPNRYPQGSPMSQAQARTREGSSTNPSSPSLASAAPTSYRRQTGRASLPGESSGSLRSQSQPGRALPHPLTMPQMPQGYDFASLLAAQHQQQQRASQAYAQSHGMQIPFSPLGAMPHLGQSIDSAMPKEYVGYYVGQSPQLGPQQQAQYANNAGPVPPMQLRDPPTQRQRRVTPDLAPPQQNGRHTSRSPSPLGHLRNYSIKTDRTAVTQHTPVSPTSREPPMPSSAVSAPPDVDLGGPLIVNGSTPSKSRIPSDTQTPTQPSHDDRINGIKPKDPSRGLSIPPPLQTKDLDKTASVEQWRQATERQLSPTRISPTGRNKPGSHLTLQSPQNGTPQKQVNGMVSPGGKSFHESTPLSAAPLLSPVAELRTPSPTQSHVFDKQESPCRNRGTADAVRTGSRGGENATPSSPLKLAHRRKDSIGETNKGADMRAQKAAVPVFGTAPAPLSAALPPKTEASAPAPVPAQNPWQQIPTRKGHKKSKSANSTPNSGGQPLPVHSSERKGG